jgi:hypothetical protein
MLRVDFLKDGGEEGPLAFNMSLEELCDLTEHPLHDAVTANPNLLSNNFGGDVKGESSDGGNPEDDEGEEDAEFKRPSEGSKKRSRPSGG